MLEKIHEILAYWFESNKTHLDAFSPQWDEAFEKDDQILKQQYEPLFYLATQGKLRAWLSHPKSALAYILLIDQLVRRMYRNSPIAYQYESLSLEAADLGREHKLDKELSLLERFFFYMPYAHSENIHHQKLCLGLVQKIIDEAREERHPALSTFEKAYGKIMDDYDIILNFGRFPQRNEILERESTQDELLFLSLPNNRF